MSKDIKSINWTKENSKKIKNIPIKYWRSLDSLKSSSKKNEDLNKEFNDKSFSSFSVGRRQVLKIMGASFALAGAGVACRRPEGKILPYSRQPEEIVPGVANYFATIMPRPSDAVGLVVESHEGRPTKIEGNKEHSSSCGVSDYWAQSSVLQLYDPDRSRHPMIKDNNIRKKCTWDKFDEFANGHFLKLSKTNGSNLAFLIEADDSPTALRLKLDINKRFSNARWFKHDQLDSENSQQGVKSFFGDNSRLRYNLKNAKIILSLQADPLMSGTENLRNARGFGSGRKIYKSNENKMNRLYVAEAVYSLTGANADHRLKLAACDSVSFLKALSLELFFVQNLAWPNNVKCSKENFLSSISEINNFDKKFITGLAKDLIRNKGKSVIIIGENQDSLVHSLGHFLNIALEGLNKTFSIVDVDNNSWSTQKLGSLNDLSSEMNNGNINTLIIIDANPAYTSSKNVGFSNGLKKVTNSIHLGLYDDETANLCKWHLPMSHFLESWGDIRAYSGESGIVQPLIAPLHYGRSKIEIFALIAGLLKNNDYNIVKKTWCEGHIKPILSTNQWKKALHDGVIVDSSFKLKKILNLNVELLIKDLKRIAFSKVNKKNVELIIQNDYSLGDGRYSNLSWLQEMPDPVSKLTWGNALYISPFLAKFLKIKSRVSERIYLSQVVEIVLSSGEKIKVPTFVMPGINDYSLSISLGYGRINAGYVGNKIGVNVYNLLQKDNRRIITGIKIILTDKFVELASTQEQFAMNGEVIQEIDILNMGNRAPARSADLSEYKKNPNYIKEKALPLSMMAKNKVSGEMKPVQMTKSWDYNGNKWGMVIDLSSCIGCNACSVACQAENNVPVVGEKEVKRGRAMQWLRVDRYFTGDVHQPKTVSQPVPCMQCENAPCEPVCPVAATVHDDEGLNAMAYNRCIGTRYCANNCPYKVRRFNYFDFSNSGNLYVEKTKKERQKLLQMQKNPNVTIRYRGVMEKCTYCTQRISKAKIEAKRRGENSDKISDGVVVPACAQSCPTEAITFGNLNDKNSKVSTLKKINRNYDLLDELNVRPRTSYLSKLRNTNSELV